MNSPVLSVNFIFIFVFRCHPSAFFKGFIKAITYYLLTYFLLTYLLAYLRTYLLTYLLIMGELHRVEITMIQNG